MWNNVRRRLVALVVVAGAVLVGGAVVQSPALAAAPYGGDVKRSIAIERAKDWFDRKIPYNQSAYAWDENKGRKYRTDCSGYVAMAWKLNGSSTDGSAGIFTGNLDDYSHVVNFNDLLQGDALLRTKSTSSEPAHVMLFDKWSSGFDSMWIYEESNTQTDMQHKVITASWFHSNDYAAVRYDHMVKG